MHILAVWNKIIAEKQRMAGHLTPPSAQHRMTKATRVVLIGKGNRKCRRMDLLGKVLLSTRRKVCLKLLTSAKYASICTARITHDYLIDVFWPAALLLRTEHAYPNRQQLFRVTSVAGKKRVPRPAAGIIAFTWVIFHL